MLNKDPQLPFFMEEAKAWIAFAREKYRGQGEGLMPAERDRFRPYFRETTLDRVRVAYVSRIEPPGFVEKIRRANLSMPIDLDQVAGLTLIDTIVVVTSKLSADRRATSVLFQELVHVCQYERWTAEAFIEEYLRVWISTGCSHSEITFEKVAEKLRMRFDAGEGPFSVEALLEEIYNPIEENHREPLFGA
jgi:hypothetical protein